MTVTVNVTLAPNCGAALSTVLVTARSAVGTSTLAAALSLPAFVSNVAEVAVAVFVISASAVTLAVICKDAPAPFARLPTLQLPPL